MSSSPIDNIRASITYSRKRYGVSDEAMEYRRRRGPDKIVEPTDTDWQLYHAALDAIEAANTSPHIWVNADIDEPEPSHEPGEWIETEGEWIGRVAQLLKYNDGRVPDDLDRALSMREAVVLKAALGETGAQITGRDAWTRQGGYHA